MEKIYNQFKIVLLAAMCLASVLSLKATTYDGDLIVGFTTQANNDVLFDLGPFSTITNGQTWSGATLGISSSTTYYWGVVGDTYTGNAATGYPQAVWTTSQTLPANIPNSGFNSVDIGISTLVGGLGCLPLDSNGNPIPGQGGIISATYQPSWNYQTIVGANSTTYHNAYLNPNAYGPATNNFYQVTADNSAPVLLGTFSLTTNISGAMLTYRSGVVLNPAPVASFQATTATNGFAPLTVGFTNSSTGGSFTNSIWNFGNGTTITNLTGGNVTNTYATGGSYTVTLIVNGAGGSSTNMSSNYIVVTNAAPTANFTGATTNGFTYGFVSLRVIFTNMSTGSFTNSVWNFGNGTIITNLTGGNVTNTYAVAGTNTVTLTVIGSGGASTNKLVNYIVALPPPVLNATNLTSANGKLVFSCLNSPAGVQYRILSSTNLTLAITNWTPVYTNTFPNPYTNSSLTNPAAYFRLVSP